MEPRPLDTFASLPLSGQIAWLEERLGSEPPERLMETAAGVRDSSPLSWLSAALLTTGYFQEEVTRTSFASFLIERPETAVNKMVKTMLEAAGQDSTLRELLSDVLVKTMECIPLVRLSSMCLVDRALKHNFPNARTGHLERVRERCLEALSQGALDQISVDRLAQLPAASITALRQRAAECGPEISEHLSEKLGALAVGAVEVIAAIPKAVSQSNAEELLARKVYTDPGHFLIELLQNAEDSGATTWRLTFARDRITVWHDGAPFDTKDVVGITSIGQTTKSKSQIGFFGVGFKSIYEVTDRPQLFSEAYRFEIVDISIPKTLGTRPSGFPEDGTLLILPLRDPDDPERSARAMFEKARALDPVVLFTLKRMAHIELVLEADAGGPDIWSIHEVAGELSGIAAIEALPAESRTHYLICDEAHRYTEGLRQAGKADATPIMVGVQCDARGVPRPLDPGDATVYSYLPTGEHSGLRFFLQAHFDVPVDRERIAGDSAWNRWINAKVPALLGRTFEVLDALPGDAPEILARAAGFLDILPLPQDLNAPIFRAIPALLQRELAALPLIPDGSGTLRPPDRIRIAPPSLTRLTGHVLSEGDETVCFAHPDLTPRQLEVAAFLGARPFGVRELVEHFGRVLVNGPAGIPEDHFLHHPSWETMDALYTLLLGELSSGGDADLLEGLRRLPLILTDDGSLASAEAAGIFRGSLPIRQVYAEMHSFVHVRFDATVGEGESALPGAALMDRLGIPTLSVSRLLQDLLAALRDVPVPLTDPASVSLLGTPGRMDAILTLVAEGSRDQIMRVAALPLFPGEDGAYHPLARNMADTRGLVGIAPGELSAGLVDLYRGLRPVLHRETPREGPVRRIMDQLNIHRLSLATFIKDVEERRVPALSTRELFRLHRLLAEARDELTARMRKDLAALPLWPDGRGEAHPLLGRGAVFIPMDPVIRGFFGEDATLGLFLHEAVTDLDHVKEMGVESVGTAALIAALASEREDLPLPRSPGNLQAVAGFLFEKRAHIHSRSAQLLGRAEAFVCEEGEVHTLATLAISDSPVLRRLYRDFTGTHFLESSSIFGRLVAELHLEDSCVKVTGASLVEALTDMDVDVLVRHPGVTDLERRRTLLTCLTGMLPGLSRQETGRCMALPLIHAGDGRFCAPGDANLPPDLARLYLAPPELHDLVSPFVPLVLPEEVDLAAPWFEVLGAAPFSLVTLLRLLRTVTAREGARRLTPEEALALLCLMAEAMEPLREAVASGTLHSLERIPLFPTIGGTVVAAARGVKGRTFLDLMEPGQEAAALVAGVTVDPAVLGVADLLGPLCPMEGAPALVESLSARIIPEEPLSRQPGFLSTPERCAAFFNAVMEIVPTEARLLPGVTATGVVTLRPLKQCDDQTLFLLDAMGLARETAAPSFTEALDPKALGRFPRVTMEEVFESLPEHLGELSGEEVRLWFYTWLVAREGEIFSSPLCREVLGALPLFPTGSGILRVPTALVTDPAMPDLGLDWTPHPSIPAALISLFERHLGLGRPDPLTVVREHALPRYHSLCEGGQRDEAARLLAWILRSLPAEHRRPVLVDGEVPLETVRGGLIPLGQCLVPDTALRPHLDRLFGETLHLVGEERYPREVLEALRRMEIEQLPPMERVEAVLCGTLSGDDALSMAALLGALGEKAIELPLEASAFVRTRGGGVRRPGELYHHTMEVEVLIGDGGDLYPDPRVQELLGPELFEVLPLKTDGDVTFPEVIRHVERSAMAQRILPMRVYQWLDLGLRQGTIDSGALTPLLADARWICTDDGEWFNHRDVVGTRALQLFGTRRGYWERGVKACGALASLFGIPSEVEPRTVQRFLEEIGAEVRRRGPQEVLTGDHALPRMLFGCYAYLGARGQRIALDVPCVLGRPVGDPGAEMTIVEASDRRLFISDTPTLEELFGELGQLLLAPEGPSDEAGDIAKFYRLMGIRRIQEAYTIAPEESLEPVTGRWEGHVEVLCAQLDALSAVLPRIERYRKEMNPSGWSYDRLQAVADQKKVLVYAGLQVRYVLATVGSVTRCVDAVYDREGGTLMVDEAVLTEPRLHTPGLAQGLVPAVYAGRGGELLVDILELTLPLRTLERMTAYLDSRHFPRASLQAAEAQAGDGLRERVAAIIDYGIHEKLRERFSELGEADFSPWSDRETLERMTTDLPADEDQGARRLVPLLWEAAGVASARAAMDDALLTILTASSINDIPPEIFGHVADPELAPLPEAGSPSGDFGAPSPAVIEMTDSDREDLAELMTTFGERFGNDPVRRPPPLVEDYSPPDRDSGSGPGSWTLSPPEDDEEDDSVNEHPEPREEPSRSILSRFFGRGGTEPGRAREDLPDWAVKGANCFTPGEGIPPQLWADHGSVGELSRRRPPSWLAYAPPSLPSPYNYMVRVLGGTFDQRSQSWSDRGVPGSLASGVDLLPSGRTVVFEGTVVPGISVLPMPMYSRLTRWPEVVDGEQGALQVTARPHVTLMNVGTTEPVSIRYEVELLELPSMGNERRVPDSLAPLTRPSLKRFKLPVEAQTWLARVEKQGRTLWERAMAVQEFVQSRYIYDLHFKEQERVRRTLTKLKRGKGNHHLQLLHAGKSRHYLGRGVCYELNTMAIELLRHLSVPAVAVTGWLAQKGMIGYPDHFFALALIPGGGGFFPLPVEGSTGAAGAMSPVASLQGPGDEIPHIPLRPAIPSPGGVWSKQHVVNIPDREEEGDRFEAIAALESQRLRDEFVGLAQIHRQLRTMGVTFPPEAKEALHGLKGLPAAEQVRRLRSALAPVVGGEGPLNLLISVNAGSLYQVPALSAPLQQLIRLGLIEASPSPAFTLRPLAPVR